MKDICQITEENGERSSLQMHERAADGQPLCNTKPRPWEGKTMIVTSFGRGEVTCGRCLRSAK